MCNYMHIAGAHHLTIAGLFCFHTAASCDAHTAAERNASRACVSRA